MTTVIETLFSLSLERELDQIIAVVAASFFICSAITALPWPKHWSEDVRGRITSTVHAFVSTALALRTLGIVLASPDKYDLFPVYSFGILPGGSSLKWDHREQNAGDAMWKGNNPAARYTIAVTLGYMIYDSVFCMIFPHLLDTPMMIHHFIAVTCYSMALYTDVGVAYSAFYLINEASTPFVNIYAITRTTWEGLKKATNGLAMWITYAVFRIACNTLISVSMIANVRTSNIWAELPWLMIWIVANGVLINSLNVIWFYKITMGLMKAIKAIIVPSKESKGSKSKRSVTAGIDDAAPASGAPAAVGAEGSGSTKGAGSQPAPITAPARTQSTEAHGDASPSPTPTPITRCDNLVPDAIAEGAAELSSGVRLASQSAPVSTIAQQDDSARQQQQQAQPLQVEPDQQTAAPEPSASPSGRQSSGLRKRRHDGS